MLEALKTIGSFGGLISAIFLIYDRFLKNRPIISLRRSSRVHSGIDLRVENVSTASILLTGAKWREGWRVATDHSVDGIMDGMGEKRIEFSIILDPAGKWDFPMPIPSAYSESKDKRMLWLLLSWRDLRYPNWPTLPVLRTATPELLGRMLSAKR